MTQQTVKSKAEPLVESGSKPLLIRIHCWNCGKLLARLPKGSDYQIKCPRCKMMNGEGAANMKIGDKVIDKDGYIGVVSHIWKTGQIAVEQKPNVTCTYDHANMLTVIEG